MTERQYSHTEVQAILALIDQPAEDALNALIGAAYEAAAKQCELAAYGQPGHDDMIELGCLRSRDYIRSLTPADAIAALEQVRRDERERCAKIADSRVGHDAKSDGAKDAGEGYDLACDDIATTIRGETE